VQIYAADHPRDAATRKSGVEFGRPVRIGSDVWIGGGAIILARRDDRRRGRDRRRQRGDTEHRGRRYRDGKSGPAAAGVTGLSGFAIYPSPCYGKPHVCAAHHTH
jgi:hypothetical protein